eukprot:gene5796-6077_t
MNEGKSSECGDAERQIPVAVITGFLGSGKTSLIRRVLSGKHGMRIAVIMNEYGENVEDASFITDEESAPALGGWVSVANGCMCCRVKGEFVAAVESLMAIEPRTFDYILVESTGLANPGPIASALWSDKDIGGGVELDAIITVVDAVNINRQLHDPRPKGIVNEAQVQIAYADLILLNKMDLCDEESIIRSEADIRAINSTVPILHTTHCDVDLAHVFYRKLFAADALDVIAEGGEEEEESSAAVVAAVAAAVAALPSSESESPSPSSTQPATSMPDASTPNNTPTKMELNTRERDSDARGRWLGEDGMPGTGRGLIKNKSRSRSVSRTRRRSLSMDRDHTASDASDHVLHDPEIAAATATTSKPLDLEKFQKVFMQKLLWDRETHPDDIYRVKGVLSVAGSDSKHSVQAVYELFTVAPIVTWEPSESRVSTVVVIGRNLKSDIIQRWLDECC